MNFKLTKEFFGGIIHDRNRKNNIAIDLKELLLLNLINPENKNFEQDVNSLIDESKDTKHILFTLRELSDFGLISPNVEYDLNKSKGKYLSAPFRLFYDITYLCNLRCGHCFTNSGKPNSQELCLEEKLKLVDYIKELGIPRVSIAGGEPFACKDLYAFIKKCNDNDIGISLSTNGTLFDQKTIDKINKLNIKTLTISFDGGTKDSMDKIRGQGSYEKVIENLYNLKKHYKGKYCIKTTLMKSNIDCLEQVIKIGIECGCSSVKFNTVREDGRATENKDSIILTQKEYIDTMQNLENLKQKYANKIKIKNPLNIFSKECYNYIEELGFGCFAGKESICVDALGNVRPCSHFPKEFICGNVKNQSLYKIWHESKILSQFRNFKGNSDCNNCDKYDKCRGGCRYRAFLDGNINGVDSYCYEFKNKTST